MKEFFFLEEHNLSIEKSGKNKSVRVHVKLLHAENQNSRSSLARVSNFSSPNIQRATFVNPDVGIGTGHTLKFYVEVFLSDWLGTVRQIILYTYRSCCLDCS